MRRGLLIAALAGTLVGGCAAADAQLPTADPAEAVATAVPGQPGPVVHVPPTAGPAAADVPAPSPDGTGTSVVPGPVPVRSATGVPEVPVPVPPVRLRYGAIGAEMPIDPVGVAADGQMEVPEDANRAGWYRFGPGLTHATGTVVVAGHAGSYVTPRGPLYDLRRSAPGDRISLERGDGTVVEYEVVTAERVAKSVIDLARYFRRDGEPRLVLFTCGGEWEEERQSYRDNVVVTARLVGA